MGKRKTRKGTRKGTQNKSRTSQKKKSASLKSLRKHMTSLGNVIDNHPDRLCHIDLTVGTNHQTYEKARTQGTPVFARIHAKWCGHCQAMKQDWEDLKEWHTANVKDKTSPLHSTLLVSVEDTELPQVTEKYPELQASGYPTLMLVKNGKVVKPFTGPRNLETFKTFMNHHGSHASMHGGRKKHRRRRTRRRHKRTSRRRRR